MNSQSKSTDTTTDELDVVPESYPVLEHQGKVANYHEWLQQGPYLKCQSCEQEHGAHIGTEYILMGTDSQGQPMLEKI